MKESVDVEFKEVDREKGTLPSSCAKEIVAFANTGGGDLYIGISDDGTVRGVQNTDDTMKRLSSMAHDTILPNIMPFLQIRPVEMDGKDVIKASVSVGTQRPYYLSSGGLTPRGVYVRVGSASIPLGESGIREMILETSGASYEECRSINQNLTFDTLQREMKERGMELGQSQMEALHMTGSDGLYTNLALLLSEECTHTIKVAVFQGKDGALFRDRKEFSGSLLKQLNDAYDFLELYNKTEASFSGLRRTDTRDYPEPALREALLNSIIHRDYLFSGSTIINVFDDRIEFVSLGGLVRGISMEAVMMGVSQSRNPNLQSIFYRLKLVESYGTGIRKIIRLYSFSGHQPEFRSAEGGFSLTLYNLNEEVSLPQEEKSAAADDETEKTISLLARETGEITRKEVDEKFGFSSTKSFHILKKMCDKGLLVQQKKGYQTVYISKVR